MACGGAWVVDDLLGLSGTFQHSIDFHRVRGGVAVLDLTYFNKTLRPDNSIVG